MRNVMINAIGLATVAFAAADTNKGSAPQDKFANIRGVIDSRIDALKASENATHKELAAISRELLDYVPATADIGRVNRLLEVLGRMNRQLAVLFFRNFLPWKYDETALIFTSKEKGQTKIDNKMMAIANFLKEESNDIWSWQRENVAPVERKVNFGDNITNLVKRALDPDNKDHIDHKAVFNAVLAGGIELDTIIGLVTDALKVKEEEENKAKLAAEALAKQQQTANTNEPATPKAAKKKQAA